MSNLEITVGDSVYLKASHSFCAWDGRYRDLPRRGPLTVSKVYQCGEHIRITAHGDGFTQIDAAVTSFEKA